jgi:hypothetical protein
MSLSPLAARLLQFTKLDEFNGCRSIFDRCHNGTEEWGTRRGMTTKLALDKAGRVVLPKALRDELGLAAGESRLRCGRCGRGAPTHRTRDLGLPYGPGV